MLLVVWLPRDSPQLLGQRIVNDHGAGGRRPEGGLRVVGLAVDDARRNVARIRALAVARVEGLLAVRHQVRIAGLHCDGQTVHRVVANAAALEVGVVLRRSEEFVEGVAAEEMPRSFVVAEGIAHGELALAADAVCVVVSCAVHAVHAHLGGVTLCTLDALPAPGLSCAADTVEAVGARVALVADTLADASGVRAFPARHALAVRGAVRVLADVAFVTPRHRAVLLLAVDAHEASGFIDIRDLSLVNAVIARRHARVRSVPGNVWAVDAQRAGAPAGGGSVLALAACGAGCG